MTFSKKRGFSYSRGSSSSSSSSTTEQTLVFSTMLMFITYIYLTIKSIQQLPPVPSLVDIIILNHVNHQGVVLLNPYQNTEMGGGFEGGETKIDTKGEEETTFMEELVKQTPFPDSINFHTLSSSSSSSSDQRENQHQNQFESIVHPAIELLPSLSKELGNNMTVPKFYNPPIFQKYGVHGIRSYLGNFGQRLMTVQEAQSIGSKIHNPKYNNQQKSNDEPKMLETIFVAIASYRDYQCQQTIESILSRAIYPERIRIAVVDQLDKSANDKPCGQPKVPCIQNPNQLLCKYSKQLDFYEMDATYAVGPVFARHLGHRMYRGEYYAMQCDAHVDFVKGWDVTIIEEWKSAMNEMAVLTTYLSDVNGAMDEEGNLKVMSRPVMCAR